MHQEANFHSAIISLKIVNGDDIHENGARLVLKAREQRGRQCSESEAFARRLQTTAGILPCLLSMSNMPQPHISKFLIPSSTQTIPKATMAVIQ